ncbi:MAG TPA: thermonuclease family protein [Alphaproteobacteria bacterium]|nr:thermonuclease family protein [Micavibrio sp.]HQX27828.1 thermonuclease family protein [Alphaproteobacteria bacterium]
MRMKAVQSVVIMLRILVLFLIAANCFINAAYAETVPRLPSGDFSELRRTGMVNVKAVIDPQTIQLEDGHIVRLTGIDFPDFNPDEPGDFSLTAMQILRDMLVGKTVLLYQTVNREEGRINRMGQDIAQIQRESDKAWVQGTLLSLGLARVRTAQRNPEMAQQMYDLEQTAMKDKAGIWENYSKVLPPEEAEAHEGSFQIVEGRIESAALKQNRIYLNFGKDWKTDFTISIAPEDKRAFSKQNLDPLQWNGKQVRVRGWIESYNGPYMQISHPAAIEVKIDEKSPELPSGG